MKDTQHSYLIQKCYSVACCQISGMIFWRGKELPKPGLGIMCPTGQKLPTPGSTKLIDIKMIYLIMLADFRIVDTLSFGNKQ